MQRMCTQPDYSQLMAIPTSSLRRGAKGMRRYFVNFFMDLVQRMSHFTKVSLYFVDDCLKKWRKKIKLGHIPFFITSLIRKNSLIFIAFLRSRANLQSIGTNQSFIRAFLTKLWPFENCRFLTLFTIFWKNSDNQPHNI